MDLWIVPAPGISTARHRAVKPLRAAQSHSMRPMTFDAPAELLSSGFQTQTAPTDCRASSSRWP